jgi:threonine/homoserine/homoserine lactone efflux protein
MPGLRWRSFGFFGKTGPAEYGNRQIYRQGMMTTLLNPNVALFFIAFLPQFIDPVSNLGPFSFMFLGFLFLCTGTAWCLIAAVFAPSVAHTLRDRPGIQTGLDLVTCRLFICPGVSILLAYR